MWSWRGVNFTSLFRVTIYGILLFLLVFPLVARAQDFREVSKYPPLEARSKGSVVVLSREETELWQCMQQCIRDHQMVAVGIEKIEAGCAKECEFEHAMRLSRSPITKERSRGIKKLCQIGDKRALPVLIDALEREFSERTGLWAWIIPALGSLGDPVAVPVLIKTLELMDVDWMGREMSAKALGRIGEPSALPALIGASKYPDTHEAAIEALAGFDDTRVVPVLLAALEPEEDPETRRIAMGALKKLGEEAVPDLIKAYRDFSSEYPRTLRRLWICQLLGEIGNERALEVLHESLNDPNEAVRQCAARYLFPMRGKTAE